MSGTQGVLSECRPRLLLYPGDPARLVPLKGNFPWTPGGSGEGGALLGGQLQLILGIHGGDVPQSLPTPNPAALFPGGMQG